MPKVRESRVSGPLAAYAEGFRSELARLRYSLGGTEYQMWVVSQLSHWLVTHGLGVTDFTPDQMEQFLVVQRKRTGRRFATERALRPLFEYLRNQDVALPPAKSSSTEADELLKHYRLYLAEQRGLAPRTVVHYDSMARNFLKDCLPSAGSIVSLRGLTVADVTRFLLRKTSCLANGSARNFVTWLRPFLRFLYLEEITESQVAVALPPVASWRQTRLPTRLAPPEVEALLASCDRADAQGLRDFAILTLLARLGLRAIEVARLELEDINWRIGEVVIRGKGFQFERLPIPVDVGEALVAYLRDGRPRTGLRHVFVTHRAPLRGIGAGVVSETVSDACKRVGIPPVRAHRLRHTLASEMLRQGLSLPEIAQVLRHRDLAATAIYAKVDRIALSTVAQPWPGGER
jgi:integrase/recombinase XerD